MKKALLLILNRDPRGQTVKDGGPVFTNGFIEALEERNYIVDVLSGNAMKGVGGYETLPAFEQRMNKSRDFARQIEKDLFEPYGLVCIIHPSTGFFLDKNNLPPVGKTIIFPTLLGKEYAYFQTVPKEYLDLEKRLFQSGYLIQSPSYAQADILQDFYGVSKNNIVIYPRGFSPDIFTPKERLLRTDISEHKPLRIFCANAVRPQKGYEHLIGLAGKCCRNNLPTKIVIFGDSLKTTNRLYYDYAKNFLEQASQPEIKGIFEIHDAVDQKLLNNTMLEADIALVPSIYESFGKTALECSGSGLPTIVFNDVLAYREFLTDSCAVFSNRDNESLFYNLKHLASNAEYYHSLSVEGIRNGKKYIAEKVYNAMVEKLLDILEKRLSKNTVDPGGFEPPTSALQMRRSTN